jgi:3-phytase
MKDLRILLLLPVIIFVSCNSAPNKAVTSIEKYHASLDSSGFSVYLGATIEKSKVFTNFITANSETDPVKSKIAVDAADDPAIWINKVNPENSLILGTNKHGGIHVYNMHGKELQFVQTGCMNNIDLRDDFNYKGKNVVLVAATNCTLNTISLFYIDKEEGKLSDIVLNISTNIELVYGLCMYKSVVTGKYYVFVNGEKSDVQQWEVFTSNNGLQAELVREFKVSSRPEGMVTDDEEGVLYIGVEEEGILKVKAEPQYEFETVWVTGSNPSDRSLISSDIEGIALYKTNNKSYLIASSQGNFSYAIFEINEPDKYITSFVIKDGTIDGVEETDGLEIANVSINNKFPKGFMVVHDGFNFSNDSIKQQNFKFISLEKIDELIP